MTPYYEDDACTIYHGDCREVLPELEPRALDVVLTDFPYGIGKDYDGYEDTPAQLAELIDTALPLMRNVPVVALTCGVGNMWRFPPPRWVLCWYQNNSPTASGAWGFNAWQPVLVYGSDPFLVASRGRRSDVVVAGAGRVDLVDARDIDHPCPKPLGPWTRILRRVSCDEDDMVLDPFMGSGTTLVAAKYTGRRAIGIELSERYCEIAAERLAQEVLSFMKIETTK